MKKRTVLQVLDEGDRSPHVFTWTKPPDESFSNYAVLIFAVAVAVVFISAWIAIGLGERA